MKSSTVFAVAIWTANCVQAYDQLLAFRDLPEVEHRSIDDIYQAALAEGGVVTCWHGGDAPDQQDALKTAFEQRFPGMTLNITVDLSKYHDLRLDQQLAFNNVYVDSIILQSLHDYPRWSDEGALLRYEPLGFDMIRPAYRDAYSSYYGVTTFSWSLTRNAQKSQTPINGYEDFLKPEYRNKLVLTYPNDDDAVLQAFDLMLLEQNPQWVRGTQTPSDVISQANSTGVATFTSNVGFTPAAHLNVTFPDRGQFTSWPQHAAILKDAPHPEGAKLLHAFYLSEEYQKATGKFSVRSDVTVPGQPFDFSDSAHTDPTSFARFMADRARVERLRTFFEDKIGTAQGLSPLKGGLY